jgi:hypothetical protein
MQYIRCSPSPFFYSPSGAQTPMGRRLHSQFDSTEDFELKIHPVLMILGALPPGYGARKVFDSQGAI